jgi:anthranilate phosphoribosyltransferase
MRAALERAVSGERFSRAEMRALVRELVRGDVPDVQVAALLVALRTRGETVEETIGAAEAMRELAVPLPEAPPGTLDTCGTGGDGANTFNVSTVSALVVAGAGVPVAKHGNRAASSACGAADLLEALGVAIELGPDGVARCVEEAGIGFCFAPRYHPAMRHAGPSRRDLGIPTAFNILGPLSNPGRVRRSLIGVADLRMAERMAGVLHANGSERALIVHGGDGLDELTTTGPSTVVELQADGKVTTWSVDPDSLGIRRVDREDLVGGDAATNAELARRVLAGEAGPHRDIVCLNAGAGLLVAGLVPDLPAGLAAARDAIDSGAAVAALHRMVEVSQAEAGQAG